MEKKVVVLQHRIRPQRAVFAGFIPAPLTYFAMVKDLLVVAQQTNGLSIFD